MFELHITMQLPQSIRPPSVCEFQPRSAWVFGAGFLFMVCVCCCDDDPMLNVLVAF
jgi:hypothetical protein